VRSAFTHITASHVAGRAIGGEELATMAHIPQQSLGCTEEERAKTESAKKLIRRRMEKSWQRYKIGRQLGP